MKQECKINGWFAARNRDETLHVFQIEPRRIVDEGKWWDRDYISIEIPECTFPELAWEDKPIEIELKINKL